MAHLDEKGLATAFKHIKEILAPVKITYAELKKLRDAGELVAGRTYRVTDYEFTTTQSGTKSAGHVFDILVTAADEKTLLEEASAMRREGDENLDDATVTTSTDSDGNTVTTRTAYFANNNLSAWKIWYSLDNDTSKYAWADADNGKGVIYRLIDEYCNDVDYDVKNALFKLAKGTEINGSKLSADTYYYTFQDLATGKELGQYREYDYFNNNRICTYIKAATHQRVLPSTIFISPNTVSNNTLNEQCRNNIIVGQCVDNSITGVFYGNSFSGNNIFNANSFSGWCYNNIVKGYVTGVSIPGYMYESTIYGRLQEVTVAGCIWESFCSGGISNSTFDGIFQKNYVYGDITNSSFYAMAGCIIRGAITSSHFKIFQDSRVNGAIAYSFFDGQIHYVRFLGKGEGDDRIRLYQVHCNARINEVTFYGNKSSKEADDIFRLRIDGGSIHYLSVDYATHSLNIELPAEDADNSGGYGASKVLESTDDGKLYLYNPLDKLTTSDYTPTEVSIEEGDRFIEYTATLNDGTTVSMKGSCRSKCSLSTWTKYNSTVTTTSLVSVIFGDTMAAVGDFSNCTLLTTVTLPKFLYKLNDNCFAGCTVLETINYLGTVSDWNNYLIKGTDWNKNVPATKVICADGEIDLTTANTASAKANNMFMASKIKITTQDSPEIIGADLGAIMSTDDENILD